MRRTKRVSENSGQAAMEMAVVFILLFIMFIGAVRVFSWVNSCLVERHRAYMATRGAALNPYNNDNGTPDDPSDDYYDEQVNFYNRPDLELIPDRT